MFTLYGFIFSNALWPVVFDSRQRFTLQNQNVKIKYVPVTPTEPTLSPAADGSLRSGSGRPDCSASPERTPGCESAPGTAPLHPGRKRDHAFSEQD